MNLILFLINLGVALLCGAFMAIIPWLTRKSYLFGVKIPIEAHACAEAKQMRRRYILTCLAGSAFAFLLMAAQYLLLPEKTLVAIMYFPLLIVAVQMAAYIPNWKRAARLKEERRWKVSGSAFAETKSSHTRGNLSELPWAWYALGLLIIAVSIVYALARYPSLPEVIPTHWGINMEPDAWSEKSILTVLAMPLVNLGTLLMMWLTNLMFVRAKLQIDPQNPALSFAQHHIYRRRVGHSMGFLALGIVAGITLTGLMSINPDFGIPMWLLLTVLLLPMAPVLIVPVRSGQGGCKIKPKNIPEPPAPPDALSPQEPSGAGAFNRGDDKHWLLGLFYHNPGDPANVVEDRFGGNLGFKYPRRLVQVAVAAFALALVAMYAWLTVMMWHGVPGS